MILASSKNYIVALFCLLLAVATVASFQTNENLLKSSNFSFGGRNCQGPHYTTETAETAESAETPSFQNMFAEFFTKFFYNMESLYFCKCERNNSRNSGLSDSDFTALLISVVIAETIALSAFIYGFVTRILNSKFEETFGRSASQQRLSE